jgi:hypothetical protein
VRSGSSPIAWNSGLEQWRERALAGLDASLKERQEGDPVQAGLDATYQRVGELSMENELLREKIARMESGGSFRRARSRRPHLGRGALVLLGRYPADHSRASTCSPRPRAAGR